MIGFCIYARANSYLLYSPHCKQNCFSDNFLYLARSFGTQSTFSDIYSIQFGPCSATCQILLFYYISGQGWWFLKRQLVHIFHLIKVFSALTWNLICILGLKFFSNHRHILINFCHHFLVLITIVIDFLFYSRLSSPGAAGAG